MLLLDDVQLLTDVFTVEVPLLAKLGLLLGFAVHLSRLRRRCSLPIYLAPLQLPLAVLGRTGSRSRLTLRFGLQTWALILGPVVVGSPFSWA